MIDGYADAQSKADDYLTVKSNADKLGRLSSANDVKSFFRLSGHQLSPKNSIGQDKSSQSLASSGMADRQNKQNNRVSNRRLIRQSSFGDNEVPARALSSAQIAMIADNLKSFKRQQVTEFLFLKREDPYKL